LAVNPTSGMNSTSGTTTGASARGWRRPHTPASRSLSPYGSVCTRNSIGLSSVVTRGSAIRWPRSKKNLT
jgi:hypothetical protein